MVMLAAVIAASGCHSKTAASGTGSSTKPALSSAAGQQDAIRDSAPRAKSQLLPGEDESRGVSATSIPDTQLH
jgi:hypothetical protein